MAMPQNRTLSFSKFVKGKRSMLYPSPNIGTGVFFPFQKDRIQVEVGKCTERVDVGILRKTGGSFILQIFL